MCLIIIDVASNLYNENGHSHVFPLSQVRVVLLAAAPVDRLFVHTGGEDERDRQLLDDLGLSGVKNYHLPQRQTTH